MVNLYMYILHSSRMPHTCAHTHTHIHIQSAHGNVLFFWIQLEPNTIQSVLFNRVCLNVLCIITSATCIDFGSHNTMTWDTTLNNSEFVKQVLLTSVKHTRTGETQYCTAAVHTQYMHMCIYKWYCRSSIHNIVSV